MVERNVNAPVFVRSYSETISENILPGTRILQVEATDEDGDELIYYIDGPANALQCFYVTPKTGVISPISLLDGSNPNCTQNIYQLVVKARDQRIPEKTGQGIVTLNINRDRSVPFFIGEPYRVNITNKQPVGTGIIQVRAEDRRLSVSYPLLHISITPHHSCTWDSGLSCRASLSTELSGIYLLLASSL